MDSYDTRLKNLLANPECMNAVRLLDSQGFMGTEIFAACSIDRRANENTSSEMPIMKTSKGYELPQGFEPIETIKRTMKSVVVICERNIPHWYEFVSAPEVLMRDYIGWIFAPQPLRKIKSSKRWTVDTSRGVPYLYKDGLSHMNSGLNKVWGDFDYDIDCFFGPKILPIVKSFAMVHHGTPMLEFYNKLAQLLNTIDP